VVRIELQQQAANHQRKVDMTKDNVQEPFGYLNIEDIESHSEYPHNCRSVNLWHEGGEGMIAIYTTPPAAQRQWVGLTDEEVDESYESVMFNPDIEPTRVLVYQAIETKLKEKNA
jgi:hypothetical protein